MSDGIREMYEDDEEKYFKSSLLKYSNRPAGEIIELIDSLEKNLRHFNRPDTILTRSQFLRIDSMTASINKFKGEIK